jgi:hypothetical protein
MPVTLFRGQTSPYTSENTAVTPIPYLAPRTAKKNTNRLLIKKSGVSK